MNDPADFAIAQERHWYRIPVNSVLKRWPPQWLAFYQTKIFSEEKYSVKYFARVHKIQTATRQELFPDEPTNEKSSRSYYQLMLDPLQTLSTPIISQRWRRIVFIPTTWEKFIQASEINDLYDESPLEDRLWAEFKRLLIFAERQYYLQVESQIFCMDFALFCRNGKLNIETDGAPGIALVIALRQTINAITISPPRGGTLCDSILPRLIIVCSSIAYH